MEGKKGVKRATIPKISPVCNLYLHVMTFYD
jgi:hypothetical protein